MKGIVFNLLEECVREDFGESAWDAILDKAGVEGAYTSLGTYNDAELGTLVMAASQLTGRPAMDLVRWFGEKAARIFSQRYPAFYTGQTSTRSFLLTLNDIIHPEVKKLYPGAQAPHFRFELQPDGGLVMGYESTRSLCAFAEGLIVGTAPRFGEIAVVTQPTCKLRGDTACILAIEFKPAGT